MPSRELTLFAAASSAVAVRKSAIPTLQGVGGSGWTTILDTTGRARWPDERFQTNTPLISERVQEFSPVYACTTRIANDIGKLRQCLKQENDATGVSTEVTSNAFSPVLASPNDYQNHIQFKEWWITSKLSHGNTYVLKARDGRGVVTGLYILHPHRVQPLVSDDGAVFYRLSDDNLAGLEDGSLVVPASEIIHDRMNCLFHPLIGTSPLLAAALSGAQGLNIQRDALAFFKNGAAPGGVLTAPGQINDSTAKRMKDFWEDKHAGRGSVGMVAVLGDGVTYQPMRMTSVDAQLAEQLKLDAIFVCSAFGVPPFKIGLADLPVRQTVSDLNQIYYSDCLQSLIEEYELCMTEGIGADQASAGYCVELDIDGLLRMDPASQIATLGMAVDKTIMTPNEARAKVNLGPQDGGDRLWKQVQNYSLGALAKRDDEAPAPAGAAPLPEEEPVSGKPPASEPAVPAEPGAKEVHIHVASPAQPAPSLADMKVLAEVAVASLPSPEPAKAITLDDIRPLVSEAVAAMPIAEPEKGDPGKSVTIDDVRPLVEEAVKAAKAGEPDAVPIEALRTLIAEQLAASAETQRAAIVAEVVRALPAVPEPEEIDMDALRVALLEGS